MTDAATQHLWRAYNHGSGARMWFLARGVDTPNRQDHYSKAGTLVRYKTAASAQRAADRLNAA